jgi:hypothetical protein
VLASLGALHIVNGLFVLDKLLEQADTGLQIDADIGKRLDGVIDEFALSVGRHHGTKAAAANLAPAAAAV